MSVALPLVMRHADQQVYQDLRISSIKIYWFDIHLKGSLRNVVKPLLWGTTKQLDYVLMSGLLLLKYGKSEEQSESIFLVYFQKIT